MGHHNILYIALNNEDMFIRGVKTKLRPIEVFNWLFSLTLLTGGEPKWVELTFDLSTPLGGVLKNPWTTTRKEEQVFLLT